MQSTQKLFIVFSLAALFSFACASADQNSCKEQCQADEHCVDGECVKKDTTDCTEGSCTDGLVCVDGQCVCAETGRYITCPTGNACCPTGCKDLSSDAENCSSCGNKCPTGQRCVNSNCVPDTKECDDQEKRCDGMVVQLCDEGMWKIIATCRTDQTCDPTQVKCVDVACQAGSYSCLNNNVMICGDTGWATHSECSENQKCNSQTGNCDDIHQGCVDGSKRCTNDNKIEVCNNGEYEFNEDCGDDKTCTPSGSTASCVDANLCGNGEIDAGEDCDKTNLNNKTCADVVPNTTGTLTCTNNCKFDTSACEGGTLCTPDAATCNGNVHSLCNKAGTAYETTDCGVDYSEGVCDKENICICNTDEDCKLENASICSQNQCYECAIGDRKCVGNVHHLCESNQWVKTTCTDSTPTCDKENICVAVAERELIKFETLGDSISETTNPGIINTGEPKFSQPSVLQNNRLNIGPWGKTLNLEQSAIFINVGPANITEYVKVQFSTNNNGNASAPNKLVIALYDGDEQKLVSHEHDVTSAKSPIDYKGDIKHNFSNLQIRIGGYNSEATGNAGTLRVIVPIEVLGK
ncbi:MAG: hypothetical protein WC966_03845 [Bradymonadales bacterium]